MSLILEPKMSKSRKMKRKGAPPAEARGGSRLLRAAVAVVGIALLGAGVFWWSKGGQTDAHAARPGPEGTPASNQPTSATAANPSFTKLQGKWLRPDGGYILEIRSAAADGQLEAAYLNPRPIHVAKAGASRDGENLKVFVELRDVNYPGSTYTLAYDPPTDQLKGIYYQAALGQQFEVYFQRIQ